MGSAIMDAGAGSPVPEPKLTPMPCSNAPPPFLMKTYDMVDDPSTDKIVSWSPADNSFVIWDPPEFAKELLPKYFKHSNFSSFVRQLNTYGFRKVGSDLWKFSNDGFIRGQKHLLRNISRRKPAHGQSQQQQHGQSVSFGACVEVGKFGLEKEVEWLNRDKNVLMQELVKLRQHHQTIDNQMQTMVQNLQIMEQRQQQMMSFLAKAVNSPGFLAQFAQQQNDNNKRMMECNKKRRIRQDIPLDDHSVSPADGQLVKYQPVMNGAAKEILRQMTKLNSSPRLENFSNSPESSLTDDALDGGSNNRISGVTLQEVSPSFSQPITSATSAIAGQSLLSANIQFSESNSLVGAQDLPPILSYSSEMIVPVPSQLQEIVPENNMDINGLETGNDFFMDPTLWGNGQLPLEIDIFPPDLQIKWQSALIDNIGEPPSVGDPSWEKFLQSLYPTGTEEVDPVGIGNIKSTETEPLENGRGNVQHMEHLTEQMGLLTPNWQTVNKCERSPKKMYVR